MADTPSQPAHEAVLKYLRGRKLEFGEALGMVNALVDGMVLSDQQIAPGDLAAERKSFEARVTLFANAPSGNVLAPFLFRLWILKSPNAFAAAYLLGQRHAKTAIRRKGVASAAAGRRLIGLNSRNRVREAADKFRNTSKEDADPDIADLVGLSSGTVRRYLSELFPGKSWSQKL